MRLNLKKLFFFGIKKLDIIIKCTDLFCISYHSDVSETIERFFLLIVICKMLKKIIGNYWNYSNDIIIIIIIILTYYNYITLIVKIGWEFRNILIDNYKAKPNKTRTRQNLSVTISIFAITMPNRYD